MRFRVIVADPAWSFNDKLKMSLTPRSAGDNYSTMSVADIAMLPVADIADPVGCVLVLWVPSALIEDGLLVLRAWGFTPKGTYVWTKMKRDMSGPAIGMGHLFRQCHEIALVGTIGKPLKTLSNKSQRSACLAVNEGHSVKPEALQDSLDKMFPSELKCELFARRVRDGWICLGFETDGFDLRDSLPLLAAAQ